MANAIELVGAPALDGNVFRLQGDLTEATPHRLIFDSAQTATDHAWITERRSIEGVTEEVANMVTGDLIAHDIDVISFGVSKTASGECIVIVEVLKMNVEIESWMARQPLESVLVFPFISLKSDAL